MKLSCVVFGVTLACVPAVSVGQVAPDRQAALRTTSRAVVVDVVVTDRKGNPVTGLRKDAFRLVEQGKPQSIAFFEEHRGLPRDQENKIQLPPLPLDVFSNFSPVSTPPAVNILLLDALNTPMTDQMYLRQSAADFLKTLKPGSRLAIFTLSLKLRFVEGFTDDPALLAQALGYAKRDRAEPAVLIPSIEETVDKSTVIGLMNQRYGAGAGRTTSAAAAAMIQSFQQFMQENEYAQTADREYRTTQALQQLATYLGSIPGRKNLIWLSGGFPLDLFGVTDMRFDDTVRKTVNLLSAARVALYPVDARGAWTYSVHTAENRLDQTAKTAEQMIGPALDFPADGADPSSINKGQASVTVTSGEFAHSVTTENSVNNTSHAAMDIAAERTGGRAFYNKNNLGEVVGEIVSSSSNFYTLSYSPTNANMDGGFRNIAVKIEGGPYSLSYRRGYFAREDARPGAAQDMHIRALQQATTSGANPLEPFMDLGLPESLQILYIERIVPSPAPQGTPAAADTAKGPDRYSVDFVVSLKDLNLKADPGGLHKGSLDIAMLVYDRYGQVVSRRDHRVNLEINPENWAAYQQSGLLLHADLNVPRGQYWLRTGIYDHSTHKVGTMEVPFTSVHPLQASLDPVELR